MHEAGTITNVVGAVLSALVLAGTSLGQDQPLSDARIENALESQLESARGVDANELDVRVSDREVTLSGTVDDILAKQRAARIAGMVKGVRTVDDRTVVADSGRTDSAIRTDVVAALASDPATDSWEIDVRVNDGAVTLQGQTESRAEMELAGTVARSVRGVRSVKNEIGVDYEMDRPDGEIASEIRQRLRWDARVNASGLDVSVAEGEVEIDGVVGSAYELELAVADAWVAGVRSVDADAVVVDWASDELEAADMPTRTDEAIRGAVSTTLAYEPRVPAQRVDVAVNDGRVTLTGAVGSLKAKRAAAQAAADVSGVRRVTNFLRVRPATDASDASIARSVREAIARDPWLETGEIDVRVDDGRVVLDGEVDSYFERSQAEDLAAGTLGVRSIDNELGVDYDVYAYESYYDWDPILYDYGYDYETVYAVPDHEIREDIESELFWSPFVDSDDVDVTVENGTATLTGTVEDWDERSAAAENAIEGGATGVINRLEVQEG